MDQSSSALRALAERAGILSSYVEQGERAVRETSDETRVALLAAMGVDASTEAAARQALDTWGAREADEIVAPVRVVRRRVAAIDVDVRVPSDWHGEVGWLLTLAMAAGGTVEHAGRAVPDEKGRITLCLPGVPEPGYHCVRVRLQCGSREASAEQFLVVAPPTCPPPRERLGGRRVFGLAANLYAVRSERNWGVGDFTDLAALGAWAARHHAAFVGVNPLHALRNTGGDVSPYRPVSRIYRNALYLDVGAIPELADAPAVAARIASADMRAALAALHEARWLDYDRVWTLKAEFLEALYTGFRERHLAQGTRRAVEYRAYVEREGHALDDHATFLTIEETLRDRGVGGPWKLWPRELQNPRSAAVADFRQRNGDRVGFYRWLQFELDRQLGCAAESARSSGLDIGLYQDLAIGCAPDGSDAWANQHLLIDDVNLGAPPDQYSDTGQDWGLPPINPHVLRETRYEHWISLIRSALQHCGALRIDHVLGLFRQFWIPAGKTGAEGAYVRFPTQDLLGILALEATRAGALIVGEDLGTVPPEVPPTLREWEILGTKVMYFERESGTGFRPAATYDEVALTVADTHDQVPLAGFLAGRDIEIRRDVGLLTEDAATEAHEIRAIERVQLIHRLAAEGLLDTAAPDDRAIRRAAHAFVCATPSLMAALTLEDVVGETEPVNVPAAMQEQYPSWRRRLATALEALDTDPDITAMLAACEGRRQGV